MQRTLLTLLISVALLGCSKSMGEKEYADAFKSSCEAYLSFGTEMENKPFPDMKGLSKEERNHAMARLIRQDYAQLKKIADDHTKLQPPEKYKGLHSAYLEFLNGQYQRWMNYADAIDSGDRANIDLSGKEIDTFTVSQMGHVVDEMEKSGVQVGDLRKQLDDLVQRNASGG